MSCCKNRCNIFFLPALPLTYDKKGIGMQILLCAKLFQLNVINSALSMYHDTSYTDNRTMTKELDY